MGENTSDEFDEGYTMAVMGMDRSDNPFFYPSVQYLEWDNGWKAYFDEEESLREID